MAPVQLSNAWYRRLYMALFVISLAYVASYVLRLAAVIPFSPDTQSIDTLTAGIAAGIALTSIVLYFVGNKITSFVPPLIVFSVFAITTALFIQSTGGIHSPFLMLWTLIIFVAPVFGAYGWVPALVLIGAVLASEYLGPGLTGEGIVLIVISSAAPLIAGIILWRELPDDTATKNVKSLANQLSEVATKSEIVINAIGDGVIAVDGKGIIQLINPAAQKILGWGKQDALMLSYKSILKMTDENNQELNPAQDPIQEVLNNNQQARGNKIIALTSSGKKLSISLVASPIGDPGAGAIAVFRDITNERAEEREQAEFISTASHEMRTPVASIEGYLGLALNPNTATIDEKARDFIMKAHEAAQHLGRLFQDLLDVSKSEDGRMQNIPKVVDIVPFTESITQGLQQKATEKGLDLIFVPTNSRAQKKIMPVYYINLDNDHVREVLDNLIENAIKYTPQGEVRVDINGTEDKVIVSIKDTGLGIPAEDIPHLFQKFYRVENMDRQSIGGTGLGLYLCRRLVEAMQGRLWVESTFGQGSTFFVELPRIESQEAARLKEEQERQVTTAAAQPVVPAPTPIPVTVLDTATPATPAAAQDAGAPPAAQPATAMPTAEPQPNPLQAPVEQPQQAPGPEVQQPQAQAQQQTQPVPDGTAPAGARPATTVPRGESLTREQINERVRQLEALAQQQRGTIAPPPRQ